MFWSGELECLRDSARNDFIAYRQWFGLLPPKHEPSILLGDLGRFTPTGDFLKLGSMFQPSGKRILEKGNTAEKWVSVERPAQDNLVMSEEMVFDPFVSKTTGWTSVPEEFIHQIKFLALRKADRNSLTYEYVTPTSAVKLGQLRKAQWAHALLLGGPMQRHEMRHPKFMEWVRLNSKALRRQLELLPISERDDYGLVLVLTTFTSPGYTDIRFLNDGDAMAPLVLGCTSGGAGCSKWLRGYPLDSTTSFDGEVCIDEGQEVEGGWTIFLDGYSIRRTGRGIKLKEAVMDIFRSGEAKEHCLWRKDVSVHKISTL